MVIPADLEHLAVPIEQIRHYPGNARRHARQTILDSLKTNGQYRPIVVNRRTNHALAGNGTLDGMLELGATRIAVTYVDVDDQAAARIVAVDNRANDQADYDDRLLLELLRSIDDLTGTGYDTSYLDELEAMLADEPEGRTDPDDVPPEPRKPYTKLGQVWRLGPHRLAVGDALDAGVLLEATAGRQAELVLTDPPYNVGYTGKTDEALTIENDDMSSAEFAEFMATAYAAMFDVAVEGAPIYVFHSDSETEAFRGRLVEAGWLLKQCLIWVKQHFVMSRQDYHWQHEPILYGWKPGAAHRWYGGFTPSTLIADDAPDPTKLGKAELLEIVQRVMTETTVLRFDRPARSEDHPTAKPVDLLEKLITNSSRPGDTVLDPFGGSGSTLIAAHRTRRIAAIVEKDPVYADVICRRYQEHTGERPVLDRTGKPHDFTR